MATDAPHIKTFPYMTIIEGRRPYRKAHTSIGHAKSAVQGDYGHAHAEVYVWNEDQWQLMWDFPENRGPNYEYPWETIHMKRQREAERDERFRRQVDEIDQRQRADRLRRELIEKGWTPPHD